LFCFWHDSEVFGAAACRQKAEGQQACSAGDHEDRSLIPKRTSPENSRCIVMIAVNIDSCSLPVWLW